MRYPAAETAEKHQKILAEASRLFKERGFGVSVSEIMKSTGLTHGPFYNHFESKEALMAECITHSAADALVELDAAGQTPEGMRAYVRDYMSHEHRDARAEGCLGCRRVVDDVPQVRHRPLHAQLSVAREEDSAAERTR